jgi:hypothetical protein
VLENYRFFGAGFEQSFSKPAPSIGSLIKSIGINLIKQQ